MKKLLALFLFTAACGSDSGASSTDGGPDTDAATCGATCQPFYTSGSRIKMRSLTTVDGAKQYVGWHDMMYGDDCAFEKTSDGATRCMPLDVTPHLSTYADAACSQPAVFVPSCNPPPKYIQEQTTTQGCASTTITSYGTIWQRGAQLTTVYQKVGSNCSLATLDATVVAYGIGTEIPLGNWQSASIGVDP